MDVRAGIYLRISLDAEMDGLAIERQRQDCEALLKLKGWTHVQTYVDQSISATDRTKKRPGYLRMISDYEAGLIDAIVCYDLDRLTRQPRELEDWIERAETKGVLIATANGEADLTTDAGRLFARIKAAVARAEVDRKGERQSRAQRQRAQMGRPPKGVRPVGYKIDGTVIPREAVAVKEMFDAFARGASINSIARALSGQPDEMTSNVPALPRHTHTVGRERATKRKTEGKTPRPIPPDGPWRPSTVMGILRNPRYAGYSVYSASKTRKQEPSESRRRELKNNIVRDEHGEVVKGNWEPIVAEDTWWAVQNVLDDPKRLTNRTGSTVRKHLGAGLYRCGECGRKTITNGIYYACPDGHLHRTKTHVDTFVKAVVVERLKQKDLNRKKRTVDPDVTDEYSQAIARQRARIARAEHDYDLEVIQGTDLKRIRDAANKEIRRLEAERLTSGAHTIMAPVLLTDDPARAFLNASMPAQRIIIDTLMSVTLKKHPRGVRGFDPTSIDITWKED